jgi:hypothetical protein
MDAQEIFQNFSQEKDDVGTMSHQFFRKTLYPLIQQADQTWSKQRRSIQEFTSDACFKGSNFDLHLPSSLANKIRQAKSYHQRGYEIEINGRNFCCMWISMKRRKNAFYERALYKVYLWLFALCAFKPALKRLVHIYIYLLPDRKELPDHPGLRVDDINTGSTSASKEIYIFREEEWFKVLIHETFHSLDFSGSVSADSAAIQTMLQRECFPALRSEVLLFESYCEFWADVLHTFFVAYFSESKAVYKVANHLLSVELAFSRMQCVKVLRHYGLTYADLFQSNKSFQETESNSFAYYVLKCVMMQNSAEFLDWHFRMNGANALKFKEENIVGFCQWLCAASRSKRTWESLAEAGVRFETALSKSVRQTLRMVCLEDDVFA